MSSAADTISVGEVTAAGLCTMCLYMTFRAQLPLPPVTHEVTIDEMPSFRCCERCANEFARLNSEGVKVVTRAIGRGIA